MAAAPDGTIYYASLAGTRVVRIDTTTGGATVIDPPTARQGARRVWADSKGRIWVSEWNTGKLGAYDPQPGSGGNGVFRGYRPKPMPSTWTRKTGYG